MLKPLYAGREPLGGFDGLDTEIFTLKGGEVVTFDSIPNSLGDKAAADVYDGYAHGNTGVGVTDANVGLRTVVRLVKSGTPRPLMLADDGLTGYGTMFGTLVGGQIGAATVGASFGPHSAAGSGKVTCWDKPGVYAVSLDAIDATTLAPALAFGTGPKAGTGLYSQAGTGLLTSTTTSGNKVGSFIEFSSGGSLVNTSAGMAAAFGSGGLYPLNRNFKFMVFQFNPSA